MPPFSRKQKDDELKKTELQHWPIYLEKLQKVTTQEEAYNLVSREAVPENHPARIYYRNLGQLLQTKQIPVKANVDERKEFERILLWL